MIEKVKNVIGLVGAVTLTWVLFLLKRQKRQLKDMQMDNLRKGFEANDRARNAKTSLRDERIKNAKEAFHSANSDFEFKRGQP